MSGYHWSDDPVLVARDNKRRQIEKESVELGFRALNEQAICNTCAALVYIGPDWADNGTTYLRKHREWHDSQ